jgi:hypothetical protein
MHHVVWRQKYDFLGFSGAAQGEESRFRTHQAILTILIAVQYFKKAEKFNHMYSCNLHGRRV